MSKELKINDKLFSEIKRIIDEGKHQVAQAVNVSLTATYWHIGKRINDEVLNNKRADYGKQIVASLGRQLTNEYGSGFLSKNLRHMMKFAEVFPDNQIVSSLMRQLSWTHFNELETEIQNN